MISAVEYIQLKAFARQDGFFLGLFWCLLFFCFVYSMRLPMLQMFYLSGVVATPFVVLWRMRFYRDKVLTGVISYRRAFAYGAMVMAYASVLLTAATLVYFYFLDGGTFLSALKESFASEELRQSLAGAGFNLKDLDEQVSLLSQARPVDIAISTFSNSVVISLLLSVILALIVKRKEIRGV
jgi:membrane-associated protease RseP (regulator of RpoE activity)